MHPVCVRVRVDMVCAHLRTRVGVDRVKEAIPTANVRYASIVQRDRSIDNALCWKCPKKFAGDVKLVDVVIVPTEWDASSILRTSANVACYRPQEETNGVVVRQLMGWNFVIMRAYGGEEGGGASVFAS